jgi:hypothetical protein
MCNLLITLGKWYIVKQGTLDFFLIQICESKEEFEDTKEVIKIRISKNRHHNGQKKKIQKDKQRSTKHTLKSNDRITRTQLKTGSELMCSGRVSSSCSISDTRHVNLVTNLVISHERLKDRGVLATGGTYPWSFMTQIFHNGQPSQGCDHKTFELMTSI